MAATNLIARMVQLIPASEWSKLRTLGNNRIIKSSYFWMIMVPIAAKALDPMPDKLVFSWFDPDFQISLTLPFSWGLFFFASIAFAAATLIYSWKCPAIVKLYRSFNDFREVAMERQLLHHFYGIVRTSSIWRSNHHKAQRNVIIREFATFTRTGGATLSDNEINTAFDKGTAAEHIARLGVKSEQVGHAFTYLQHMADWQHLWARRTCWSLYAIGFVFLALVMIQNGVYVFRSMF